MQRRDELPLILEAQRRFVERHCLAGRGIERHEGALDVGHLLTYFVAHESHHRGQLALLARQFGAPLPAAARSGLWQWKPPRRRRRRA